MAKLGQIGVAARPAESDVFDMWFRRPRRRPDAVSRRRSPNGARRRRGGFTLIEASLAIVIIGVGVVAAMELLAVGSKVNGESHRLTTGMNLAANVRELAQEKTGAEVLALNGQAFSPPRDARNAPIDGLGGWQQVVTAARVVPGDVKSTSGAPATSRLIRLSVGVQYRGRDVTSESWLVADTSE